MEIYWKLINKNGGGRVSNMECVLFNLPALRYETNRTWIPYCESFESLPIIRRKCRSFWFCDIVIFVGHEEWYWWRRPRRSPNRLIYVERPMTVIHEWLRRKFYKLRALLKPLRHRQMIVHHQLNRPSCSIKIYRLKIVSVNYWRNKYLQP